MSGQGWDETGILQNPKWRKLFAPPSEGAGCGGEGQVMHKGTYDHTPSPHPLNKKKEKPHHLTPNSNVTSTPALLPIMPH